MAEEQVHKLSELDEALNIDVDDFLYLVRSPYTLETSFKLRASTLAAFLIAGAAGDVFGPASSTDGTIPLFDGNTGKNIKGSTYTPDALLNRANHVGLQDWTTINPVGRPTTLLGYGILDGTGPISILDEGTSRTTKVTSINFIGSSVAVTAVDGNVTVTIEAAGVNTMLLDEAQLNTGVKTFTDATLLVRNNSATATTTIKTAAVSNRIITIPDTTDTLVTLALAQTLTSKTLTSPVINVGSDASGDLYFRNAGVFSRLAIGSAGQIMTVAGGLPAWAAANTPFKVNVITANTTLNSTHQLVVANSATDFTITLPDAGLNEGRAYLVKSKNSGIITLDATGLGSLFKASSIASITLAQGDSYWAISDGTTWILS